MGLRSLAPRMAQPSDLESPIPSQAEQTFGELMGGASRAPAMAAMPPSPGAPVPQEPAASNEQTFGSIFGSLFGETPKAVPAQGGAAPAPADRKDLVDDLVAELQSDDRVAADIKQASDEDMVNALADELAAGSSPAEPDRQEGAGFLPNLFASLPKTTEGKLSILRKIYGDKNVQFLGENFTIRKDEQSPWISLNKEGLDPNDLTAHSGDIAEGLLGATLAGLGAAGLDALALMPQGRMAKGAVALGVSGAAAGIASLARSGFNAARGVQEQQDFSVTKDALWSAGLDVGFGIAGKGVGASYRFMKNAMSQNLPTRIAQATAVKSAFNTMRESLKLPKAGEVGAGIESALETIKKGLESRVGAVRTEAMELAKKKGMENVSVESGLKKLREIIGDRAVEGGEFGELLMKTGDEMQDMALAGLQRDAFGMPGGESELKFMVEQYNALLGLSRLKGGVPLDRVFEVVQSMQQRAFNPKGTLTEDVVRHYRTAQNAFVSDRNKAFEAIFEGETSPAAVAWKQAYEAYAGKIEKIGGFMAAIDKKESAEKIVDALIKPKEADNILELQKILGPDSPHMEKIRALWLQKQMDTAIDPVTGLLDGRKFLKNIDKNKWGEEMLDVLLVSPKDAAGNVTASAANRSKVYNRMQFLARQMDQIYTADFFIKRKEHVAELFNALTVGMAYPREAARTVFKMLRENPDAAEAFSNEGLDLMMKLNPKSVEYKKRLLEGMSLFSDLVENSRRVKVTRGGKTVEVLVPGLGKRAAMAGPDAIRKAVQANMTDQMQNRKPMPQMDLFPQPSPLAPTEFEGPTPDLLYDPGL